MDPLESWGSSIRIYSAIFTGGLHDSKVVAKLKLVDAGRGLGKPLLSLCLHDSKVVAKLKHLYQRSIVF
jgi:hypothetical protein